MFGTDYDEATGYDEFRIELFSDGSSFKLRARSENGETMLLDYYPPVTGDEIEEAFAGAVRANAQFALKGSGGRSTSDEIRALGERLYNSVWQSHIRDLFHRSFNMSREKDRNLRLRFVIDHPGLAELPWEFLFDPSRQDFLTLSTRTPIARQWMWPTVSNAQPEFIDPPLRILIVEAEVRPWDTGAEDEIADLQRLAKDNPHLVKIVDIVPNACADSLIKALTNDSYNVLHLCLSGATDAVLARRGGTSSGGMAITSPYGESSRAESLLLEDKNPGLNRSAEKIDLRSLREAILSRQLQLITLSGDCTDWLASQLTQESPATLGWRGLNTPEAYQSFSERFYSSLVRGLPLEAAVTHGRKAIDEKYPGGKEWGMLVFYMQSKNGVALRQPRRAAETTRYNSEFGAAPSNPETNREWTKLRVLLSVAEENYRVLLNEVGKYGENAVPDYINSQVKLLEEQISTLTSDLQQLVK